VRLFPFNRIEVSLVAASDHARARLEAIAAGVPSLRDRIVERLETAGCRDVDVDVSVQYMPRPQKHWPDPDFAVSFARLTRNAPAAPLPSIEPPPRRLDITVLQGTATQRHYAFTADRVDLGRGGEVRDTRHGLVRTNHVAFTPAAGDGDHTISRQHAHIAWDAPSGGFRVHDDGSVHGTRIQRSGKTVPVPFGSRGVRLQSGDEIVLGAARVRIKM
jgi:hypothetical protein